MTKVSCFGNHNFFFPRLSRGLNVGLCQKLKRFNSSDVFKVELIVQLTEEAMTMHLKSKVFICWSILHGCSISKMIIRLTILFLFELGYPSMSFQLAIRPFYVCIPWSFWLVEIVGYIRDTR